MEKYVLFTYNDEYVNGTHDLGGAVKTDGTDSNVTSSGELSDSTMSSGGDPRQKAIAGMRRRRRMKSPVRSFLKDQMQRLALVMMATSTAVGAWSQEVLMDPAYDVWAVFQPSQRIYEREHFVSVSGPEVDCLELFAGSCKISGAFAKRQRGVLRPRDLLLGDNFRRAEVREEILCEIDRHRPRLVWMAPPCTYWCGFSRLNYDQQQRRRLRQREKILIEFTEEVLLRQRLRGGLVVVENPRSSDIWRHSSLARWIQDPEMCRAEVDLCTYGLESENGEPMKKGLTLLTNQPAFANSLSSLCHGGHDHVPVQGRETALSAVYPDEFARAVVRSFDVWWKNARLVWMTQGAPTTIWAAAPASTWTTSSSSSSIVKRPEDEALATGAAAISFKGKVNATVAGVLKRVHQNLGHPPTRELVRHLRIGGAPESVVRAAEQLVCKTCEKCKPAKPHKVSSPVVALDFNEVVAMDVIWVDSAESENLPALNIVDLASTYQVVVPLKGTKSEDTSEAFAAGWMRWAGAPKILLVDLDSAFKDRFLTLMDERNIQIRSSAGQAHWQNGTAERHGASWKLMWAKFVEENLVLDSEVEEAMAAVSDAKNQLRNRSGYSPRQWVFGANQKLQGDCIDGDGDVSSLGAITASEKLQRGQALRMGARAAFFQVQNKEALQRAVSHKPRVQPEQYLPGDLVYIYREVKQGKTKKPAAHWTGPGAVIGREGSNYWIARGGRCLLAAQEHVRSADHEEVSEMLRLKLAMRELHTLMKEDNNEFDEIVDAEAPPVQDGDVAMEAIPSQDGGRASSRQQDEFEQVAAREAALRSAAKRNKLLDDVPEALKKARTQEPQRAFMVKRCVSEKGKEKQLEKELPWGMIPPDERPLYRQAEEKQWQEHVTMRQYELYLWKRAQRSLPKSSLNGS